MKALWFLTYKSFWNGVKRALRSPRRLIGLLFFAGYYFMFFIRPAMMPGRELRLPQRAQGTMEFPSLQVIEAFAFAILAALSLFMMLGISAQQSQTGFKPADVDVLFATPIRPRIVLLFRMMRDYLITLVLPFLIVLLGIRPVKMGWEAVFRNFPESGYSALTFKALTLSWLLMAMAWVTISYAVSLFVNRSDRRSSRNKKVLGWTLTAVVLGTVAFIAYRTGQIRDLGGALELAHAPLLRIVFFTGTLATQLAMAPLTGDAWGAVMGGGGLVALVCGALYLAMSQSGWMYDQAAAKGFEHAGLAAARRRGDTLGAVIALAQQGKVRAGRRTLVHKLKMRGPWALVWKEFFLQTRGMFTLLLMLSLMGIAFCLMPALFPSSEKDMGQPAFYLLMQATSLFMITMALSQTGFIEVLRRVDLQKPLPFSPQVIVFFEIAAKSLLGTAVAVFGALAAFAASPSLWPYVLASLIYSPALSLLLSASVFLVTITFPDVDDPSQRQFRSVMMLLALVILALPPTGVFVGLWALRVSVLAAALVGTCVAAAIVTGICFASGKLYESYNPSE